MDYLTDEERKEVLELTAKRNQLVAEIQEHQAALTQIKNNIRNKMLSTKQYKACCNGQQDRTRRIGWLTAELRSTKELIAEINLRDTKRRSEAVARNQAAEKLIASQPPIAATDASIINDIMTLRDEYRRFSADPTRVSSMRRNAAEFANRLDEMVVRHQRS